MSVPAPQHTAAAGRDRSRLRRGTVDDLGGVPDRGVAPRYTRGRLDDTAMIAAAWGVTAGAPLPTSSDPTLSAARLVGLPYQAWYASDDDIVPAATVTRLTTMMGPAARAVDVGRLGHTQRAIGAASSAAILELLQLSAA